ncbi:MAG: hypothetical protein AAFY45_21465 [Bacteroidota bacterium]
MDNALNKSINKMTKAELVQEIKRLKSEMKDLIDSSKGLIDPQNAVSPEELLKLEAEKDEWIEKSIIQEEKLAETEEDLLKQKAFYKEFEDKYKAEKKSWEKQEKSLRSQLEKLRTQFDAEEEELAAQINSMHKVSFRLDFYKQDDGAELTGKIEQLTSRQKKSFSGLDQKLINDFMAKHLSHLITKPSVVNPEKIASKKAEKKIAPKPETQPPKEKGKLEFQVESGENRRFSNLLSRKKDTIVSIVLNPELIDMHEGDYQWQAKLFSKSMRSKEQTVLLGKFEGKMKKGNPIQIKIAGMYMPQGPNRVNANLNLFKKEEDIFIPQASYDLSGLAYVE